VINEERQYTKGDLPWSMLKLGRSLIVLAQLIFYGSPTRVAVSCIYNSLGTYPWKPKLFQATSSQMSKLDFGTGPKEAVMTKKEI
jgi:hypothetical protein